MSMPSNKQFSVLRDPGLFTAPEATRVIPQMADAACAALNESGHVRRAGAKRLLIDRLTGIADKYVRERRFHTLPAPQVYRRKFTQIATDAERLLKHLDQLE